MKYLPPASIKREDDAIVCVPPSVGEKKIERYQWHRSHG
jgi:hypothetical protein